MGKPNPDWWWIENIFTIICMTAIVLGLYFMGAGNHSFWGFLLLLNLNGTTKTNKRTAGGEDE